MIPNSEWDKPSVTNKAGRQDIIGHIRGYAVYIEVKRDDAAAPTTLQRYRINKTCKTGALSFWCYNVKDAFDILEQFARARNFRLYDTYKPRDIREEISIPS